MPRLAPVIITDRIDRAPTECNLVLLPEWRTPCPSEMACPHPVNVRFGSLADISECPKHVRFAPESGHVRCNEGCPLRTNSGHSRREINVRFTPKADIRNAVGTHVTRFAAGLASKQSRQFPINGLLACSPGSCTWLQYRCTRQVAPTARRFAHNFSALV